MSLKFQETWRILMELQAAISGSLKRLINIYRRRLWSLESRLCRKCRFRRNFNSAIISSHSWKSIKVLILLHSLSIPKETEFSIIFKSSNSRWISLQFKATWQMESILSPQSSMLISTKFGLIATITTKRGLWSTSLLLIWKNAINLCLIIMKHIGNRKKGRSQR